MARGPESLASLLRSIVRDVEVATPTPTATDHDCDKCKDEHYYYVETRPREGHNSGAGLWERCDCDGSVRAQLKAAQLREEAVQHMVGQIVDQLWLSALPSRWYVWSMREPLSRFQPLT